MIECRARGYTLSALSEVISEDLGKKIYPSNLGRLLRKYRAGDSEYQNTLNLPIEEPVTEGSVLNDVPFEEIFEPKTSEHVSSKSPKGKDPLGIGDLM